MTIEPKRNAELVLERLRAEYSIDNLGNRKNPVDELFYILLSAQAMDLAYRTAYKAFAKRFRPWKKLLRASEEEIAESIQYAGLAKQRSKAIREIATRLNSEFGSVTLAPLRNWDRAKAEQFLLSLPRIGIKSARCILAYSLDHDLLPLDTHCFRLLCRLRLLEATNIDRAQTHDAADNVFPNGTRLESHILLVKHGRMICRASRPQCGMCCLSDLCESANPFQPSQINGRVAKILSARLN